MHHNYRDIIERIGEPPTWFDEHAVPRYGPFAPNATANIYADEAVLMLITCQACGHPFHVCMTSSRSDRLMSAYGRAGVGYQEKDGEREHRGALSWRKTTPAESDEISRIADERSLAARIKARTIHFGDPPNACPVSCGAGATMNSEPRHVLQYWRKSRGMDWERDHALEVGVQPDWVDDDGDKNQMICQALTVNGE